MKQASLQTANEYSRIREILRRVVVGQSYTAIAQDIHLSVDRVRAVCNSPLFKQHLQEVQGRLDQLLSTEVAGKFKMWANESADELYHLMKSSNNERIRKESACEILDRAGYSKVEKVQSEQLVRMAPEDIDAIKEAINSAIQ